jgi:hypothetical protein
MQSVAATCQGAGSVSQDTQPERSSAEIKEIIIQKLIAWGVKLAPLDPPLIEGAAEVTNAVARIGVKTRGPNG